MTQTAKVSLMDAPLGASIRNYDYSQPKDPKDWISLLDSFESQIH